MAYLRFNRTCALPNYFKYPIYIGRIAYGIYIRNINMASAYLRIPNGFCYISFFLNTNISIKAINFGKEFYILILFGKNRALKIKENHSEMWHLRHRENRLPNSVFTEPSDIKMWKKKYHKSLWSLFGIELPVSAKKCLT